MDEKLITLYRELGYKGGRARSAAPTRAGRRPPARRRRAPAAIPPGELLLDGKGVRRLERLFEQDREGTLALVRKTMGHEISEVQFRQTLAEAKLAADEPERYVKMLRTRRAFLEKRCQAPADIPADPEIPINPCSRRYEPVGDAVGWMFHCGGYWLGQKLGTLRSAPFVSHASSTSEFVYRIRDHAGEPIGPNQTIRIALFSDFGTGEYASRYIAKHIRDLKPHYAIHLGDVYYSGTESEFRENFRAPLDPLLQTSRLFALNGNHEMLSGGHAYFQYLRDKRTAGTDGLEQEQEGSYFCLWSDRYQVIAIDTAYDYRHDGEYRDPDLISWLERRLEEGRRLQRTNILLSQHEPFDLGAPEPAPLFHQVSRIAIRDGRSKVDYWFWGDQHYCALYQKSDEVPFVGSCIGHAGHPVDLAKVLRDKQRDEEGHPFAKARWVDVSPRFRNLRTDDLGNAGFCVLELGPGGVRLTYQDWLNQLPVPPFDYEAGAS